MSLLPKVVSVSSGNPQFCHKAPAIPAPEQIASITIDSGQILERPRSATSLQIHNGSLFGDVAPTSRPSM